MAQVQILYLATSRGLVQLANPGTSDRWRPVGDALSEHDVLAVRASATDPLYAYAGTAAGIFVTPNGGATWDLEYSGAVTALAAAPDGAIYAGTDQGAILLGGLAPWHEVHAGAAAVLRLSRLVDGRLAVVYAGGTVEILADGQWQPLPMAAPVVSEVVGSLEEPQVLYAAGVGGLVGPGGLQPITGTVTGALALLPGKPEVVLLGTQGALQRSDDGGRTLQPVDGPTAVRVLVSPPRLQDYAYAGTGSGELWLSSDRGRSWHRLRDGMPPVHDLSFARVR